MTEIPTAAYTSHLSDSSLATDPWPGFDLHPIRSTPEGSPIGRAAWEGGGAWGCGETKDSQSKGSSSAYSSYWQKDMFVQQYARPLYVCIHYTSGAMCVCVCVYLNAEWRHLPAQNTA